MPRGGSRPGAGRKPDPNSKRQKAMAAKVAGKRAPATKKAGRSLSQLKEQGAQEAANWPFGTKPPEAAVPAPAPAADPDEDDGLTDEQRAGLTPLQYLLAVMRSRKASKSARMQAAIQAAPYMHAKVAPKGKKEGRLDEAGNVAGKAGRFTAAAPPKLVAAGGKKV